MSEFNLKRVLAHSSILILARIAGAAAAFLVNILIARWFGAETLGIVVLCLVSASIIAVLLPLGRQSVGMLFISTYLAKAQFGLLSGFVRSGYRTILATSLLSFGAAGVLYALGGPLLTGSQLLAAIFSILIAPAMALLQFNGAVLNGWRRPMLAYTPELLLRPLLTLAMVAGLALLIPGAEPHVLLAGMCVAVWITAGLQLVAVWRRRRDTGAAPDQSDDANWRNTGRPWIAITLLMEYFADLHLLFAGLIFAPAEIAILYICFRIRVLANFGMRAIYNLVLPEIYAALTKKSDAVVAADLTRGNALALGYAVGVCATVYLFGDRILSLVGPEFRAGQPILFAACLTMIPRAVFGPAPAIMAAVGRQKAMIVVLLGSLALSMMICVLLVPMAGMNGLVAGYAVGLSCASIFQWWWVRRSTGIDCSIFAALMIDRMSPRQMAAPFNSR